MLSHSRKHCETTIKQGEIVNLSHFLPPRHSKASLSFRQSTFFNLFRLQLFFNLAWLPAFLFIHSWHMSPHSVPPPNKEAKASHEWRIIALSDLLQDQETAKHISDLVNQQHQFTELSWPPCLQFPLTSCSLHDTCKIFQSHPHILTSFAITP